MKRESYIARQWWKETRTVASMTRSVHDNQWVFDEQFSIWLKCSFRSLMRNRSISTHPNLTQSVSVRSISLDENESDSNLQDRTNSLSNHFHMPYSRHHRVCVLYLTMNYWFYILIAGWWTISTRNYAIDFIQRPVWSYFLSNNFLVCLDLTPIFNHFFHSFYYYPFQSRHVISISFLFFIDKKGVFFLMVYRYETFHESEWLLKKKEIFTQQ